MGREGGGGGQGRGERGEMRRYETPPASVSASHSPKPPRETHGEKMQEQLMNPRPRTSGTKKQTQEPS